MHHEPQRRCIRSAIIAANGARRRWSHANRASYFQASWFSVMRLVRKFR